MGDVIDLMPRRDEQRVDEMAEKLDLPVTFNVTEGGVELLIATVDEDGNLQEWSSHLDLLSLKMIALQATQTIIKAMEKGIE